MTTTDVSEQANAFLAETTRRNAILAVNRSQGGPQLTPIWYVWDGEAFWFSIRTTSAKYRHLQHDRDVSVLVDDPATAAYVLAYGRAEILSTDLRDHPMLRRMLMKYNVPEQEMEEGLDELSTPERVLIRLRPQQILTRGEG